MTDIATDMLLAGETIVMRGAFGPEDIGALLDRARGHVDFLGPDQELWPVDRAPGLDIGWKWTEGAYSINFGRWNGDPFVLFARSPLAHIFREVFGGPFSIMVDSSRLRYMDPKRPRWASPWHQDAATDDYGGKRIYTVWVPLQGVGRLYPDKPTIAYFEKSMGRLMPTENRGKPWAMNMGGAEKELRFEDGIELASCEPGDCVIFDSFTPHATSIPPEAIVPRFSIDFRVHAYGDGPPFAKGKPVWVCGREETAPWGEMEIEET